MSPERYRRRQQPAISILDAMADPNLFGQNFKDAKTWSSWRAFLATLFGLQLTASQRDLFRECTGRTTPSPDGHREAWLVIGRRGGKSFVLALIAVWLAVSRDYSRYLGPGERATLMIIAADRRQARVIMRYVKGLLQSVPMLARLIEAERAEAVDLTNRVSVEVHTSSFRTTRGYSIAAALCDELAFWQNDEGSSEPDFEVLTALRPGMVTIPGSMLLCASSPYSRKGALWDAFRKHHGKEGDPILVWQAPTRTMNPTVPKSFIDQEIERDRASASAEYLAQFRSDIEALVLPEVVDSCVTRGVRERPRVSGVRYHAFSDPSGGSADSFTLAIAHREGNVGILDCVREVRPPFSPDAVVAEFSEVIKSYGLARVEGDRYAGEWPRERFSIHGVTYVPADKTKSELYGALLPLMNSGRCDLLDVPRLESQLIGLERRTARGGRDSIDHAPGGNDDIANAVAGAVVRAASVPRNLIDSLLDDDDDPDPKAEAFLQRFGLLGMT
jgi:hypothetical protein